MNLERTGDGNWYVKNTDLCGTADDWLRVIEVDDNVDDGFPLPGA